MPVVPLSTGEQQLLYVRRLSIYMLVSSSLLYAHRPSIFR